MCTKVYYACTRICMNVCNVPVFIQTGAAVTQLRKRKLAGNAEPAKPSSRLRSSSELAEASSRAEAAMFPRPWLGLGLINMPPALVTSRDVDEKSAELDSGRIVLQRLQLYLTSL